MDWERRKGAWRTSVSLWTADDPPKTTFIAFASCLHLLKPTSTSSSAAFILLWRRIRNEGYNFKIAHVKYLIGQKMPLAWIFQLQIHSISLGIIFCSLLAIKSWPWFSIATTCRRLNGATTQWCLGHMDWRIDMRLFQNGPWRPILLIMKTQREWSISFGSYKGGFPSHDKCAGADLCSLRFACRMCHYQRLNHWPILTMLITHTAGLVALAHVALSHCESRTSHVNHWVNWHRKSLSSACL